MGRNRYVIANTGHPHFLTCTILEWLPVFTKPETTGIVLDSWKYLRANAELRLHGYVILENHLHFIAASPQLDKDVSRFKSYTARQILDYLHSVNARSLLNKLKAAKRDHKFDRDYQLWQEGVHAELVKDQNMMRQKLDYIHANPIKRGYVDLPEHWRYSSARNYADMEGLIEIDPWWE